ncbi:MAG: hypothetical protein RLP15_13225 [Cryomorphaceae bacterium]
MLFRCLILLVLLLPNRSHAQDNQIHILFYNTENLFDTIDAPGKSDEEFTPAGKLEHTSERYALKLDHLARVIDSSFSGEAPDLLGLCEVENRQVVKDLRGRIGVAHRLAVVHFESPDQRGIDNALMYDTVQFSVLDSGLRLIDLGKDERPTRGVLWAALNDHHSKETFVVLVNHWPSRYGGQEESNWKRMKASSICVQLIDSLSGAFPDCSVVVMGDLNDHPDNESVLQLERCEDPLYDPCMVNMHKHYLDTDLGSHAYRGEWGVLDHVLVNRRLLDQHKWTPAPKQGGDFVHYPWMMYENEKDQRFYPSRFYGGSAFYGGYSDHLPARLTLRLP